MAMMKIYCILLFLTLVSMSWERRCDFGFTPAVEVFRHPRRRYFQSYQEDLEEKFEGQFGDLIIGGWFATMGYGNKSLGSDEHVTKRGIGDENRSNEITNNDKVPRGAPGSKNMFPWMVALYYKGKYRCTASIISNRDILIAGHCVSINHAVPRPEYFFGIIGSVSKNKHGKRVTFRKIILHPEYTHLLNDIAVLRTTEELTIDDYVHPICLATKKLGSFAHKSAWAMGWGVTKRIENPKYEPDHLKYTKLQVYPHTKCSIMYFKKIPDTIFCAGAADTGICGGDSGSPLVIRIDKKTNVQIGITSFVSNAFGCARLLGPSGFTKVSAYENFIRKSARGKLCFL